MTEVQPSPGLLGNVKSRGRNTNTKVLLKIGNFSLQDGHVNNILDKALVIHKFKTHEESFFELDADEDEPDEDIISCGLIQTGVFHLTLHFLQERN